MEMHARLLSLILARLTMSLLQNPAIHR